MPAELIVFWILAVVSVGASALMIAGKNPVRSALYLVLTFLCVALFYIMLSAQFIAAVQVIVYAGAIMVLFLFVIMLLNLGAGQGMKERGGLQPLIAIILAIVFMSVLVGYRVFDALPVGNGTPANAAVLGTVESIGINLFDARQPWLFPFEITSILLLIAVVGSIVMAKRKV